MSKGNNLNIATINKSYILVLLLALILIIFISANGLSQKQKTTSEAATKCKYITDKKECNSDSCCSWSGIMDECKQRETCGGSGGTQCTTNNACLVREPNNACDVSISPST